MRFPCLLISLVALLFASACVAPVTLLNPPDQEKIESPDGESPTFSWLKPQTTDRLEYTLEIARDLGFSDVLVKEEEIQDDPVGSRDQRPIIRYDPNEDDHFLPGDTEYFWRITAVHQDTDGSSGRVYPCEQPLSFKVGERMKIRILFKVPAPDADGKLIVTIWDEDFEEDFERAAEVGERQRITILLEKDGEVKKIAGKLHVLTANETTEYGDIIIDNINQKLVLDILSGTVGRFAYTLGGDKIVELTLGRRTE